MRISLNTSKWYDYPLAAFIFFTRLPVWKMHSPPSECYRRVVEYWPLTGWLTGTVMAAAYYLGYTYISPVVGAVTAVTARVLLTGALHEDGLADFFDGFGGGGRNRAAILRIMKDSRIGTYGVAGLVMYFLLLCATLTVFPASVGSLVIMIADPFSKMVASTITQMLPYARTEEESKAHVVYSKFRYLSGFLLLVQGMLPFVLLAVFRQHLFSYYSLLLLPMVVFYGLYLFIFRRLRGYTGDCCGAVFLLVELSFYLCAAFQYNNIQTIWM